MNILICDDLQEDAKELGRLLQNLGFTINLAIFYNGYDVLEYLSAGSAADVCFLDIVMPEMNGVELARELRSCGFTGEIVFLTTSKEYGYESYRVKAFDYLLKPPTTQDVRDVLEKLKKIRESSDTGSILVKTTGISRSIMFREISHVEVIMHSIHYRLIDGGEMTQRVSFEEVKPKLLSDPRFIQCHRSYIVNMDDIKTVAGRELIMRSGAIIPLSRSYPEAKKRYLQWVAFGGNRNE